MKIQQIIPQHHAHEPTTRGGSCAWPMRGRTSCPRDGLLGSGDAWAALRVAIDRRRLVEICAAAVNCANFHVVRPLRSRALAAMSYYSLSMLRNHRALLVRVLCTGTRHAFAATPLGHSKAKYDDRSIGCREWRAGLAPASHPLPTVNSEHIGTPLTASLVTGNRRQLRHARALAASSQVAQHGGRHATRLDGPGQGCSCLRSRPRLAGLKAAFLDDLYCRQLNIKVHLHKMPIFIYSFNLLPQSSLMRQCPLFLVSMRLTITSSGWYCAVQLHQQADAQRNQGCAPEAREAGAECYVMLPHRPTSFRPRAVPQDAKHQRIPERLRLAVWSQAGRAVHRRAAVLRLGILLGADMRMMHRPLSPCSQVVQTLSSLSKTQISGLAGFK